MVSTSTCTSSDELIIDVNDAIAGRIKHHHSEILMYINPKELFNYMCEEEIVEMELLELIYDDTKSSEKKVQALLDAVESSSKPNAFVRFAECVEKEKTHLGHSYIAMLLKGQEFSTSMHNDIKISAQYKKQCIQGFNKLMCNLNIEDLVPVLFAKGLLTADEFDRLTNLAMVMTRREKVSFVLKLLNTKGPTAHLLFVTCLEQKSENPSHKELLCLFGVFKNDRVLKRNATQATCTIISKVSKFIPRQAKAHGIIISQTYLEAVEKIHELQYKGNCEAAIVEVETYKSNGEVELYVALMCRNWYAYVNCHKSPEQIDGMVKDAVKSLQPIESDNRAILESRCEWMLSKYYWYMNDKQKAQYHIDQSMLIQSAHQVAPGEDTLLTHYGKACTLLDTLAEQWSPSVAGIARRLIQNANDFAVESNYGLYLSHHCIRLAQISLRSSPQCPGECNDRSDLKEAALTLESVDVNSLSPRTKCLFYITYSDYYRNKADHKEALNYVQKAHSIAKSSGFDTELESIEIRFSVLNIED